MGLDSRQYARSGGSFGGDGFGGGPGGRGGTGNFRNWSVTTWIIVVCVAVFAVDAVLPRVMVGLSRTIDASADLSGMRLVDGDQAEVVTATDGNGRKIKVGERRPVFAVASDGSRTVVGHRPYVEMHMLESALHFSTYRGFLQIQFWRFIGFQFLHSHDTIFHLILNSVGLFFFGPMVEEKLGRKRYFAFYLLCGIFGALMFTALNLIGRSLIATGVMSTTSVPFLLFNDLSSPLIGASAGVYGVIMAGAFLAPNMRVLLFFVIPVQLKMLAYGIVAIAVFQLYIQGGNAGGDAGHLGGAIAGFYFIRRPEHLHDFFDFLGRVDPTSSQYRGKRGAKQQSGGRPKRARAAFDRTPSTEEVDRILDKVRAESMASLTKKERDTLRRASRDK